MIEYTVRQGDCLASVAQNHGLFWKTIWNDPANAELKRLRKDPNVLMPGDVMHIPERRLNWVNGATEVRHRFVAKGTPAKLRLRLLQEGQPRANVSYVLMLEGKIIRGTADNDGWLEQSIPPGAQQGRLIIGESREEHRISLGHLDPVDQISGVQQRLRNLALYGGPLDGQMNDGTRAALRLFQQRNRLHDTGELDESTRNTLRECHKS
jgi:hypothetical protein